MHETNLTARVAENVTAKVTILDEKTGKTYQDKKDIGGMYIVSPDLVPDKEPEKSKDQF